MSKGGMNKGDINKGDINKADKNKAGMNKEFREKNANNLKLLGMFAVSCRTDRGNGRKVFLSRADEADSLSFP